MYKKYKILIIEDEEPLLRAMKEEFTREGFTTLAARDGVKGLKMAQEEHPHMILLDLMLPKMDGISLVNKLREDPWGEKVPVMILTNYSDTSNIEGALKEGIYDFMSKADWKLEEVVRKVKYKLQMEEGI